jgi:hypothetical protein
VITIPTITNRRLLVGEEASRWMGDNAKPESIKVRGRRIARMLYEKPEFCEACTNPLGSRGWARHHIDGNTANNDRDNIMLVCQSCHVSLDNPQHKRVPEMSDEEFIVAWNSKQLKGVKASRRARFLRHKGHRLNRYTAGDLQNASNIYQHRRTTVDAYHKI